MHCGVSPWVVLVVVYAGAAHNEQGCAGFGCTLRLNQIACACAGGEQLPVTLLRLFGLMVEPSPKRARVAASGASCLALPVLHISSKRGAFCLSGQAGELSAKDENKLEYMLQAVEAADPFPGNLQLEGCFQETLEWHASRSPEEVMRQREEFVSALEGAGEAMRKNGAVTHWYGDCDPGIAKVSGSVNGCMLEHLAKITKHCDTDCVNFFRHGGALCSHYRVDR